MSPQDFERFAGGDEQALQLFYKAQYEFVTGWLVYREQCPRDRVGEVYTDAVLRIRDKAMQGEIAFGNLRAYLLRTAINGWKMEKRRETSLLKRHEQFLAQVPEEASELDYDSLLKSEEESGLELRQQRSILAIRQALALLSEACRQLLTDTIVYGHKVGNLVEKLGLKDARGVTAKKQDCKGQLQRHVVQIMQQNGWNIATA